MILLILGFFLLLFGVFVFFKKNEGETEISILGVKLKSNNSAVLLICLGAVLATAGASSLNGKLDAKELPNSYSENTKPIQSENSNDIQGTKPITSNNENKYEELLIGTWKASEVLSGEEALGKLYKNKSEIPQNLEVTITIESIITYYGNGSFEQEAYLTTSGKTPNTQTQEVKIKMFLSGKWKVIGNELNETATDGSVTPANDLARTAFQNHPLKLSDFDITIDSMERSEILNLDESVFTVRNKKTKENVTWVRKS